MGLMRPQAKDHLEPPEAGNSTEWNPPKSLQRECGPADTMILDFWPPELGENTFLLI